MKLDQVKKSFKVRLDEKGKRLNSVANFGLLKNEVAIRSNKGEYSGFSIKALEDIKPLLTDYRIKKAMDFIADGLFDSASKVMYIDYKDNLIGYLYGIIKLWLEKNEIVVPPEYIENCIEIKDKETLNWILRTRSDPIVGKFEIVNIGQSKKGNSVVPEAWLHKIYDSGEALHKDMDNLEWRKNKPPVNYCCIYGMRIIDQNKLDESAKILFCISLIVENNKLNSNFIAFKNKKEYDEWIEEDKIKNLKMYFGRTHNYDNFVMAVDIGNISRSKKEYKKIHNVGVLVSRLQKSIRRGRFASSVLEETVNLLSIAPEYSLPEQQYTRVSGSRQLVWRLFITIFEDANLYLNDENGKYLGIQDLVFLAMLCQLDHNVQLSNMIVEKIKYTALLVQHNDTINDLWDWRKGKLLKTIKFGNDNTENSIVAALLAMPMMSGDRTMLTRGLNLSRKLAFKKLSDILLDKLLGYKKVTTEYETLLASYDMHCMPNIIIMLQAILPLDKMISTKEISSFIWENSSKINVREKDHQKLLENTNETLRYLILLQKEIYQKSNEKLVLISNKNRISQSIKNDHVPNLIKRVVFLLIFGQKIHIESTNKKEKSIDIIVAGDQKEPCKVKYSSSKDNKYLHGKERFIGELKYVEYMSKGINVKLPNCAEGYQWKDSLKDKINKDVKIYVKLIKSDESTFTNILKFYVNDIEFDPFDGSKLIKTIDKIQKIDITRDSVINNYVRQALYYDNKKINDVESEFISNKHYTFNALLKMLGKQRLENNDLLVFDWVNLGKQSTIPLEVWKTLLSKFYNNYDNVLQIGPVDRTGNKVHESINYNYEGVIMRIVNMLCCLYPRVMVPMNEMRYKINATHLEYTDMIEQINNMANCFSENKIVKKIAKIKVNTILWNHQKLTSDRIFNDMINYDKKGFGDASEVGAGKTLTALDVMVKICNYNIDNGIGNFKGFLILLPTTKLYDTWINEITKHTIGFEILLQLANGKLNKYQENKQTTEINLNTILITTLGRMRDHPIYESWELVIIDECLSVQNQGSLHTESAWKQVISAQHGVMMMSATFFRSRFDKLYYMLKMLRSGLPEKKEYLDTILSETIICNLSDDNREWVTSIHKYKLSTSMKKKYDDILNIGNRNNLDSEKIYNSLLKYLYNNYDYNVCFKDILDKLEDNQKALIYARSKDEADLISKLNNVSRYPDKSKRHVVVSYAEGTYGLNDLVGYQVIVTRPPQPDKLDQMKGRLDRPGQTKNVLYLKYFIVEDTIEEALLLRMDIANNFRDNYIMPLGEFYDLAINKKSNISH